MYTKRRKQHTTYILH